MSIYIKSKYDTWLKKTPYQQADELSKDNKVFVEKDKTYFIKFVKSEIINGHQQVELDYAAGVWWIYLEHWDGIYPKEGIELIKQFEGFEPNAYPDPHTGKEPYTIGYGFTFYLDNSKVKLGDTITKEQADSILVPFVQNKFLKVINRTIPRWVNMNDKMRGALLSFAYNLGAFFYDSKGFASISRTLKSGNYESIRDVMLLYVNPGSRVEHGLRRRRNAEADLFEEGLSELYRDSVGSDSKTIKSEIKSVNLNVPYYSQRDNKNRPHQSCNVTSVAMVLNYFDINVDNNPNKQDEDSLLEDMVNKWGQDSIYYHDKLKQVIESYGLKDIFKTNGTIEEVKTNLDKGFPVILSGKFTNSGHIIVIRGYDDKGFYVNDPYGKYAGSGKKYINMSGENLHYSYDLIKKVSYNNTAGWIHLISK